MHNISGLRGLGDCRKIDCEGRARYLSRQNKGHSMRIGDAAFRGNGMPGIVENKDEQGNLQIDTDQKRVRQQFRHGYLNGMPSQDRQQFNEILDTVRQTDDPKEKLNLLSTKMAELNEEPAKNRNLLQYLNSEMWHVMQTYNVHPKEYKIQSRDARF